MDEVRDARTARGVMPGGVAAVFVRLREAMPLPAAARELAASGVPVFPCAPGGKRPIPRRGFHEASTDLRQVEAWWRSRPRANIAIPTGAASGVVAVDVDVHGVNGYQAFARAKRSGLLPTTLATVKSPSGGRHLYFPANLQQEQRSWQVARAGIDFRGDGGYIVVPPSLRIIDDHPMPYRVESVNLDAGSPVDAQGLRDFLDPRPPQTRAPSPSGGWRLDVARLAASVANRPEGERNLGLFKAACRMAENGRPHREALDALGPAAVQAGLGEREVTRTVGSAYRHVGAYGPRQRSPVRSRWQPPHNQPPARTSAEPRALS